jgi:uncharacterized protein YdeI (YjbR/CyaY-like superfamily)
VKHLKDNLPILEFKTSAKWEQWLARNYSLQPGIWIRLYKKNSGVKSINYPEALDVALCYGWIDGLINKLDELSYIQRFTPRRPRSLWSKRNIQHVQRLIEEGRMKENGLQEVEKAKADGRWEAAYHSQANMQIPDDLLKALSHNKKAREFFENLNKTNKYSITWRLETARKPETRKKRLKTIMEMLKKGEKFH